MSRVSITREKLDDLALQVSAKTGEDMPLTIDDMADAVAGIPYPPSLQSKSVEPTEATQTITADSGYDGLSSVGVGAISSGYIGSGITRRNGTDITVSGMTVTVPYGYYRSTVSKAVASGTAGTPTATKGTVSNHAVSVTPSVTNTTGYITGGTKTGTAVSVSASELVSGTYTVDSSGTKDVTNYASASVPSGSATASATKGSVSNHSVSVTPSVTRTAGWVSAGTASGTAVTVSASELVSGSETKTENGTYDVTNLASLIVDVDGGGDASLRELVCPQQTVTPSSYEASLEREEGLVIGGHYVVTYDGTEYLFTAGNLWVGNGICLGEQTYNYDHSVRNDEIAPFLLWEVFNDVTRTPKLYAKDNNSHTIKVERIDRDSIETTNICPQQTVTTNGSYIGTLSNTTAQLVVGDYYLVTYDGTEWMLTAASLYNGDTISVGDDMVRWDRVADDNIYPFLIYNDGAGMKFYALDANASHTVKVDRITEIPDSIALTTKSITSNGTYRAMDDGANGYSSVTVNVSGGGTPRTSADLTVSGATVTAPAGVYASDASKSVASMTLPTAASATSSGTSKSTITPGSSVQYLNIPTGYNGTASYYTISAASGSSKNVQVAQSTNRATSSTYTSVCSLTCSTAGTYDVYWNCFRSTTGGTSGSQLYIGGNAYGSANTSFTNHAQTNHLTGVSLSKNQTVAVYARSRGSNYYAYCGQLTIVQTA